MKLYDLIQRYFVSWRLPITLISTFLFIIVFLVSILLIPKSGNTLSQFAADFKVWCFGYDPTTGDMEWGYVWMFFFQPLLMVGIIVMVWITPLKDIFKSNPRKIIPYVASSLMIVITLAAALTFIAADDEGVDSLVFPAERIRTALNPASFTLINQDSTQINIGDFDGRVMMITGIYSSCGFTCPMILAQIQRVLTQLDEHDLSGLSVIAISLDPENDKPHKLKSLTEIYKFNPPLFNAVTGDTDYVNSILDKYNFSRSRNPETGVIDHANLFILIDKGGKIAYRFSLGKTQEDWLTQALKLLLSESTPIRNDVNAG